MASFTDRIPEFKPYVAQLPVDAMVKVGMEKQGLYNEGIKKIQSSVDQVAGLDVIRDVDKAYLQSKVNQLGNNLKTFMASDFSDFQLVNSTAGMATQIATDPNVRSAVASTAKYRKEVGLMEDDRKAGKLTPDNEYFFNKQASSWLDNSDVKKNFSGRYVPNFDVFKYAKETFDALKPDGFSFDQIYQLDGEGKPMKDRMGNLIYSPTMTRMDKEGLFPEKVKATLSQIFSEPRVSQQLGITGQYVYRGVDSKGLEERVGTQRDSLMSTYVDQMVDLNLQQSMGVNVAEKIDDLQTKMTSLNQNYSDYRNMAYDNPDAIRGSMYKDDIASRYTTMFGYTKTKQQVMENPAWRAQFDMQKEANEQSRFAQTLQQQKDFHADDMSYKWSALAQQKELATAKAAGKAAKGVGEPTGPGGLTPEQGDQSAAISPMVIQENNFQTASENFTLANDSFLWQTMFSNNSNNTQALERMKARGISEPEAIRIMIDNAAKSAKQSPVDFRTRWSQKATTYYNNLSAADKAKNSNVMDAYNTYKDSYRVYNSELTVKKQIDNAFAAKHADLVEKLRMTDYKPTKVTYLDKVYTVEKEDALDLALYYKGARNMFSSSAEGKASDDALRRLTARGKGPLAEAFYHDHRDTNVGHVATTIVDAFKDFAGLKTVFRDFAYKSGSGGESSPGKAANWGPVEAMYQIVDNEIYAKALIDKENIIKQAYGIKPNLKVGLATGENKVDSGTLANIKRFAGGYEGSGNLASDFDSFAKNLTNNMKDNNLEARSIIGPDNQPMVEIVSYDAAGKRQGGMVIQEDEASTLNIDVNALYENREISTLRNQINYNGGKSSAGNPKDTSTYIQGDSYFDNNDFPLLSGSGFEAKANFQYANGMYYPFVYVKEGNSPGVVRQFPGMPNLQQAVEGVKKIDPTLAKKIVIEK